METTNTTTTTTTTKTTKTTRGKTSVFKHRIRKIINNQKSSSLDFSCLKDTLNLIRIDYYYILQIYVCSFIFSS